MLPDGETAIISRFEREGPGSIPGRAIHLTAGLENLALQVRSPPARGNQLGLELRPHIGHVIFFPRQLQTRSKL